MSRQKVRMRFAAAESSEPRKPRPVRAVEVVNIIFFLGLILEVTSQAGTSRVVLHRLCDRAGSGAGRRLFGAEIAALHPRKAAAASRGVVLVGAVSIYGERAALRAKLAVRTGRER